ncbi:sterol regulatory element-binding protein cleavage-activating hypothetical protein [Limosa lapponica baueri]|uniref:Uncharacterized protein n=1 Tax=Limosa lapponica baueri TaxID=1758121 RepID=A0A2I0T3A7_LIMLA|nr:sterol regulatory element-binding protein cleavage-activating hypothetical protein [Limosa lapponica baueri]
MPRMELAAQQFLSSLRSRLKLLHPSPNCTLREENIVHVHFKEEIGIAELIPLVTTYIILFAYIYFSTRLAEHFSSGPDWEQSGFGVSYTSGNMVGVDQLKVKL